jgi:hypothetical protein
MRQLRELLRLKYHVRLPQRAIAHACGIGLGTVTAYLQRAPAAGLAGFAFLAWVFPTQFLGDLRQATEIVASRAQYAPVCLRDCTSRH